MHIGTGGKKSKTEAVYYPPKLLGKGDIQLVKEGDTFTIRDGYIAFTKKFRYLGSIINSDLRDIHEIKKRIQKATNQMHELTHLWRNKHIELGTKVWLYLALPVNTLLWGCESWAISAEASRRLESFHIKSIRKILGVTMWNIEALRITNKQILKEFNNMPSMENIIAKRQLIWIGKLARLPEYRLPRQLMAAWIQHPRKGGQPQLTLRNTMAKVIQKIIPAVDKQAQLEVWLQWAEDMVAWESLVIKWWKNLYLENHENCEPPELSPEDLAELEHILNQDSPPPSPQPTAPPSPPPSL
jgi:hypothetical protein